MTANREIAAAWPDAAREPTARDAEAPLFHDDTRVDISIVHGSLASAEYALMIGGFEGEHFGGSERFLDRQFGGLLTSWADIELYPRSLGAARFIEPASRVESETEPPGGYVIGLGPLAELGRDELAFGVRQAVVDRCMRLHRDPPSAVDDAERTMSAVTNVGVSSVLIGVHEENGLRVEDSVAGIVEGVLRANQALARYEAGTPRPRRRVRITALEFVERYAERANLAAVALRSLAAVIQLSDAYDNLRSITVESRPGGLPPGASLSEASRPWRRFLITEATPDVDVDDPPKEDRSTPDRTLHLDIAALGRDARADRVRHRLDRVMVDALVDRLAKQSDDSRTAATLYDQLIPHQLRSAFQTTAGVQYIVDATTAAYPWELLGAPRPSDRQQAGSGSAGGAMRQFTETDDRRLNPVRSGFGNALVIAAGNVPGERPLPHVGVEADQVAKLLSAALPGVVTVLDDRAGELDLVQTQNALFGDHQLLHIASHGSYRAGRPESTGAMLSRAGMLTVDTVRQLPIVPDVVFLNCCHLGRIGMNRVSAGLAREFMAIGVRALVAAAWSIDDAAAYEFATTFYSGLIEGRPLGDAVTRARLACAERGGRETWAAYQCYGDPGLVIRGARVSLAMAASSPVSQSDLVARLDALAVHASDLGRPGRGGAHARRDRLLASLGDLEGWIDEQPQLGLSDSIQRRLAALARDLGDHRRAAQRYRRFVIDDSTGVPTIGAITGSTSVSDIQQAANCMARAAQRDVRAAASASLDPEHGAELDLAIELARTATDLLPDRESYGVLASCLKRAATIDPERRAARLADAVTNYRLADDQRADARFGSENALQLALIAGGAHRDWALTRLACAAGDGAAHADDSTSAARLVDQRLGKPVDFWGRADAGDRALTALIAAPDEVRRAAAAKASVAAYERAFASRSTWSERQSVLDHLCDLSALLPDDDPRGGHLDAVRRALEQWEDVHVEQASGGSQGAPAP